MKIVKIDPNWETKIIYFKRNESKKLIFPQKTKFYVNKQNDKLLLENAAKYFSKHAPFFENCEIFFKRFKSDVRIHRLNGPAIIKNDSIYFYKKGFVHNDNGPAIIDKENNEKYYYLNAIFIRALNDVEFFKFKEKLIKYNKSHKWEDNPKKYISKDTKCKICKTQGSIIHNTVFPFYKVYENLLTCKEVLIKNIIL